MALTPGRRDGAVRRRPVGVRPGIAGSIGEAVGGPANARELSPSDPEPDRRMRRAGAGGDGRPFPQARQDDQARADHRPAPRTADVVEALPVEREPWNQERDLHEAADRLAQGWRDRAVAGERPGREVGRDTIATKRPAAPS